MIPSDRADGAVTPLPAATGAEPPAPPALSDAEVDSTPWALMGGE